MSHKDTIVAQATAPGRGGIGVLRVSGEEAKKVAKTLLRKVPTPRTAEYLPFYDDTDQVIDQGIVLFFPGPNSFTGEDVIEFQGHGGPVVLDMLLGEILKIKGVRIAKPGEFTERAFLNDKLDLAQAEAIADLIDATSTQAARSALNALKGEFSTQIDILLDALINIRIEIEAAIDFPEEEIDFISDGLLAKQLNEILEKISFVKNAVKQGVLLREGMKVVIAGKPNAGKSSLLNALAGEERAIVTDIAGTTRDILREHIHIDGMPLHVIDTAGLRQASDKVEQIGIERAIDEIKQADHLLLMVDATELALDKSLNENDIWPDFLAQLPKDLPFTVIRNKADLTGEMIGMQTVLQNDSLMSHPQTVISLSAKKHLGMDILKTHLKSTIGYATTNEGGFIARARHVNAIESALEHVTFAKYQLEQARALELAAEELRLAQQSLSEITGAFTSDDLLGRIFSSFCIGK
ncbi:tRNA uridine-5-carboxymethylaminomethyl(34) synthesis GTPase MnmE [Thorsellia anophelis]|uniref:tRNA modification GTPase MnmE n=1 Tax=Thorsellia anophelis DSM 18579 TaxID=1123402 RepID=A0A1I0DH45_9GAMM|nr:tRNA uridine-5-carboxymethylaminomethyl(34) synthesis GTPase MnmE [Thorsellia anophelis]SET31524.1 tRNA modification GTPase [Thorsellia anophelis DSM 18579]